MKNSSKNTSAYDVAVVIGRWQMPHLGHDNLFCKALALAPKVIVVIGSAFRSRDTRQPFTAQERQEMILRSLPEAMRERVSFLCVRDYYDDDRWDRVVHQGVAAMTRHGDKIVLVGFKKDSTSYYLDRFSQWAPVMVEQSVNIDATTLRNLYFAGGDLDAQLSIMRTYLKPGVAAYLKAWTSLPAYAYLVREQAAVLAYRKQWSAPWYQTADAVVQYAGHILLVQRGGDIGHDLWALPGGFVEENEMFLPAALRELKEETNLALSGATMRAALKSSRTFEHPLRSPRGRLVSTAFYFAFGGETLPEVWPGSDAKAVKWVAKEDLHLYEDCLFEDHAASLDNFVGLFPAEL